MRSKVIAVLAIIVGTIAFNVGRAEAGQPALQISVRPLIVQFSVGPGGQAATRVTVTNVGTEAAALVARAIDWHTTLDGTVHTEASSSENSSSLNPFLRLSAREFPLAPGESREMTLSLVLPANFAPAPRDYWGGFFIRATPLGASTTKAFGVGANVLTYETVGTAARHLKLTSLHVVYAGAGAVKVIGRLLNDGGTYARPSIRMQLAKDARIVQSIDDSTPAIFAGQTRKYDRILSDLSRGAYELELMIEYGGLSLVQGSTRFTVP